VRITIVAFTFVSFLYPPIFAGPLMDASIKHCLGVVSGFREDTAYFVAKEKVAISSGESQDGLTAFRNVIKLYSNTTIALDGYCTLLKSVAAPEKVADPSAVCDQTISKFRDLGGAINPEVLEDQTEHFVNAIDKIENQVLHYCISSHGAPSFVLRIYWKHLSDSQGF
jgi:hypothetical protein